VSLACSAQTYIGYGVNSAQQLFRFNIASPATVTTIGAPMGFVPEGIDFRPSTNTLYAIDIGPNTTQLYTININTGVASTVGANFPSTGVGYNLTGNQTFGFDFNPTTLQPDTSMRIRLVSTNNVNLRLNSATGQIDTVDTNLVIGAVGGSLPFVDAIAYSNNNANMATSTTTLYDMDSRNDKLYTQPTPNNGIISEVGVFGFGIDGQSGIGFDIATPPGTTSNAAFAVFKRPDAPVGGPFGAYMVYNVNLATGATTGGALVGPAATPFNFDGGFSVLVVPEPVSAMLLAVGCVGLVCIRRSR